MSQEQVEVLGYSSYNRTPSRAVITFAALFDFSCVSCLGLAGLRILEIQPALQLQFFIPFTFSFLFYWLLHRLLFGISLGQRLWKLKPSKKYRIGTRPKLLQQARVPFSQNFVSTAATAGSFLLLALVGDLTILQHPLWSKPGLWSMEAFIPKSEEWLVAPFFYGIAGWPKNFAGKPIFYTLPYEKGPPTQFVGHITAHWDNPDIRLTFEGPKTPAIEANPLQIRNCFLNELSWKCIQIKQKSLLRHLSETRALAPRKWSVQWFNVENPILSPIEQTQGIYLRAEGRTSIQDRFILITAKGAHQAFILNRPKNTQGDLAFELLQKSIRSLRSFNELDAGRAWVDRELEAVRLVELNSIRDTQIQTAKLAEVQTLLLSRISVQPASLETYFHLAGTSLLTHSGQSGGSANAISRSFWNLTAHQNLKSAYAFAKDIAPADPKTLQIQNLLLESKKSK